MTISKEFYVREVRAQEKGGVPLVIGVPNNGLSIRIGDTFRAAYLIEQSRDDILAEKPSPPPSDVEVIALTVVSISYPQASVDELPAGHTGGIVFAGEGLDLVAKGRRLST